MGPPLLRIGRSFSATLRERPGWAGAAVAAIFAADLVLRRDDLPVAVAAALDEPAHVASTCLVLAAAPSPPASASFGAAALIGSVALDLDHLPEFLGWSAPSADRPPTHSALAVVLLAGLALAPAERWRTALLGFASGLAIHLGRDLATGGAPISTPLTCRIICLPYAIYALGLIGIAARIWRRHSTAGCGNIPAPTGRVKYDQS